MRSIACVLQSLLFLAFAAVPSLAQEFRSRFVTIKLPAAAVAATNEISPGPTQQLLEGVPCLIGQQISLMGLDAARHGILHPKQVLNIPVGAMIDRFHVLHAVAGPDKEGRPLASIVLHYINGASYSFRLTYGIHARNGPLTSQMPDLPDPNSRFVPKEIEGLGALVITAFDNPNPELQVSSIDLVSLFSASTPVIVALTGEQTPVTKLSTATQGRTTRRQKQLPDTAYRQELRVKVINEDTGQDLPNCIATVVMKDDARAFLFGTNQTDSLGWMALPYPPQEAVEFGLLLESPALGSITTNILISKLSDLSPDLVIALPKARIVGGSVVNDAGGPISAAIVTVLESPAARMTEPNTRVALRAQTGPDGKWLVRTRPGELTNLVFEVSQLGYRPVAFRAGLVSSDPVNQVVVMQKIRGLAGKVVDGAGNPVGNAHVTLSAYKQIETHDTDPQGRFAFELKEPAQTNYLPRFVVSATNFAPAVLRLSASSSPESLTIQLSQGSPVTVHLVGTNGMPVVGAKVSLENWENVQFARLWETISDGNGNFTWSNAPLGRLPLRYAVGGYLPHRHNLTIPSSNTVVFQFHHPVTVICNVIDAETKAPVDECNATLISSYGDEGPGSWSFRKSSYGPATFPLSVGGKGDARWLVHLTSPGHDPLDVDLPIDTNATVTCAMKRGKFAKGIVLLNNGTPVKDARVTLLDSMQTVWMIPPGSFYNTPEVVQTDEKGEFVFGSTTEPRFVIASHPDFGYAQTAVDPTNREFRVVLQKWGAVRGVVKVGPTLPTNCVISLYTRYHPSTPEDRRYDCTYLYYYAVPVGPKGEFFFPQVPPGHRGVHLEFGKPGAQGTPVLSHAVPVTVEAGKTNEVVIGGTGRTLTGKFTFPGFTDEADWTVDVHELISAPLADGLPARYILNPAKNGEFTVFNVPPGTYTLKSGLSTPGDRSFSPMAALSTLVTVPEGTEKHNLGTFTLDPVQ